MKLKCINLSHFNLKELPHYNDFNSGLAQQLPQLFIQAVTQSRLKLKAKTTKFTLDNNLIHITYLLPIHIQPFDEIAKNENQHNLTKKRLE